MVFGGKRILITGGTGSVGKVLCTYFVKEDIKQLIVFSRDEYKQHHMELEFKNKYPEHLHKMKFVIGDIKCLNSLNKACQNVNYVIHTAALKHVPICERNPIESIEVNITGCRNLIDASINNRVEKVLFISTDKATNPSNSYGATKLLGDKLCIDANKYHTNCDNNNQITKFSVIRFGNIFGSRGSLIESLFNKKNKNINQVSLTDTKIARVFISWDDLLRHILLVLEIMHGGEIFITKSKSIYIKDLIKIINPEAEITVTGLREGEKLIETLLSKDEIGHTVLDHNMYIILSHWCQEKYKNIPKLGPDVVYTSEENEFYTELEIKQMINKFHQRYGL